jgi:hypothetical protein
MSIFDSLKELLTGAQEHVQNIADGDIVQNVKDKVTEVTEQVEGVSGDLGEQAQGAVDSIKEKFTK